MDARSVLRTCTATPVYRMGVTALLVASLGCSADVAATGPAPDSAQLFWSLTLDQHAINLSTVAPYDTVRVTATPRVSSGDTLPNAPVVQYRSGDPQRLQVTSDGLVRALAPGQRIPVIATLSVGNLTHADTALVDVSTTATPPVMASFSIHPVPPDSAIWDANQLENYGWYGTRSLAAAITDTAGAAISGLEVYYTSSDTTIATIDRHTGELSGVRPGQVTLTASTTAYGVTRADTLPFTITMPAIMYVGVAPVTSGSSTIVADPSTVTIAAGGTVFWINWNLFQISITFDDPTNVAQDNVLCFCGSGNIPAFGGDTLNIYNDLSARSFPVAGTYTYTTDAPGNPGGTIIVEAPPVASRRVRDGAVAAGKP